MKPKVSKNAGFICLPVAFDAPFVCPVYVTTQGVTYYGGTWREDALPRLSHLAAYLVRIKPKAATP